MGKKENKRPTQVNLMIRGVVALYLIYLAYSMFTELETSENKTLLIAFAIIFVFAGVLIIAFSVKAFISKDYQDIMTMDSDDNSEENVVDEVKEIPSSENTIEENADVSDK